MISNGLRRAAANATVSLSILAVLAAGGASRAADLGAALGEAAKQVQNVQKTVQQAAGGGGAAAVPSGATTYLRQVDQALDRMDRMMSEASANYNKDDRAKSAEASLKEAQEKMQIVESRYMAKMGQDHPELVSRRERIAAGEKSVAAFKGEMGAAIQKENADRDASRQQEAAQQAAQREQADRAMAERQAAAEAAAQPAAAQGKIVFSKSPIDPAKPASLTGSFKAGDTIYGLIQADKSWRELYKATGKSELGLMIVMAIGGSETLQYITLKKAAYIDSAQLVLDIAPAPDKMTAYKDPDIQFGEGKGNRKIGPIAFTYELAQLPAGKHKVELYIRNYGDKVAAGEFEIEGSDFKYYADLHEKVKAISEAGDTLPPAGMVNKELEGQMRKLLENAGWTNILRVVIVDKDWWLVENTSRYLNVAAAAKDADGKCFWCNLQFTQPKLITGAWGPLELTKTGIKRNIAEENVNK